MSRPAAGVMAPAATVWPWLVQIGQDRGGLYSYDWLERLLGLDIRSADRVHPEWQGLADGDRVRLAPTGARGLRPGYALMVEQLVPEQTLVLRQRPPEHPWDGIWSFHLVATGPDSCRLLSRSRTIRPRGVAHLAALALGPVTTLMTRKMLLGIAERAERAERVGAVVRAHGRAA